MPKTVFSKKGQVVIPKQIRDELGLTPGTVLTVQVDEERVILEPPRELPEEVFIEAGPKITEPIIREGKMTGDKAQRLLKDLGVSVD